MKISLEDPEKLYAFVERNLAPKKYEKKKFGEVFTPLWLVEQILNKVPKKVWTDLESKILDPAAGIGNFSIIAYKKLMVGLKDVIKDYSKRKKHILENMLYMVELNPVNSGIMNRLLGGSKKNGYDLNIVTSNFIDDELITKNKKIDLSTIKYTLVMGNPPYSENGGNRGNSIWRKWIDKSLPMIKSKGFITLIHPPGWRKPESDHSKNKGLFKMMAHYCTPLYIEIHDRNDGIKIFNAGTRYDWYVLKKIKNTNYESKIKDISGKLHKLKLSHFSWLPNNNYKIISTILSRQPEFNNSRIIFGSSYSSTRKWVSDKKTSVYKNVLIHSTPKINICMYSSRNDLGHFNIPKVIFGETGINMPILDFKGVYGMTDSAMAIPIKNKQDGILLIKFLKSDLFVQILNSCMWSNFRIDWRIFAYFKDGFWRSSILSDKFM